MKITREQIKDIDILDYVDWLVKYPYEVACCSYECALAQSMLDIYEDLFIVSTLKDYYSGKADLTEIYEELVLKTRDELYEVVNEDRKYIKDLYILVSIILNRPEDRYFDLLDEYGVFEIIDILFDSFLVRDLDYRMDFFKQEYSKLKDSFSNKPVISSAYICLELGKIENIDFKCLDSVISYEIINSFFKKYFAEPIKELALLAYYKDLYVLLKDEPKEPKELSLLDKMKKLKEIGVFELPYFSGKDGCGYINSDRKKSRLLSDLLGYHEETIRKVLNRFI